jgi:hypothetical protein
VALQAEDTADLVRQVAEVRTLTDLAGVLRLLRRREARRRNGVQLSYRALAILTGWSPAIIGFYLTGRVLAPTDRFDTLVQVLGAGPAEQGVLATARDRIAEVRQVGLSRLSAPAALWERSDALAVLDDLLRGSAGRLVLITGEAGIGKSAVVDAFVDQCAQRATVLSGYCDPLVAPRALGPLHDIGRRLGGRFAQLLRSGADLSDLFPALVDALVRPARRRRVLVVEDVHWADGATLDLLLCLARRVRQIGVPVVVTYRDDALAADHPLRGFVAALPRDVVRWIRLEPLSAACVVEQGERAGRNGAETYRLTGGNPLLLTELLAQAGPVVPTTIRDLVLGRLARLPMPAREVAWLAAVVPTRVDRALLVDRAGEVDDCLAAGVLVADRDGVAYRHGLLRQAVEESLSPARRAALHRQALAMLAPLAGTDPARLMHHAWQAGDAEAMLRHGRAAAAAAAARGAHREAVAHYRATAVHAARLPAAERAELLEAYAAQAHLVGRWAEGLDAARQALAARLAVGQRERIGAGHRWLSRLAWWNGLGREARAAATKAVDTLGALEPGPELAMAYSNRSRLHTAAHELTDAIEWGERAQQLAERLGDVETVLHAMINIGTARLLGGDPAAAETLREVHRAASAAGRPVHAGRALLNQATALIECGDHTAGQVALDEALRYVSEHELDGYRQYLLSTRAVLRLERCEWDAALADTDESLGGSTRPGVAAMSALITRGRILAARGLDGALAALDLAAEHAYDLGEVQWIGPVAAARAEYFLLYDKPGRAAAEARQGHAVAVACGHTLFAAELAHYLWRAGGAESGSGYDATPGEPGALPFHLLGIGAWAAAAAQWARQGRRYTRLQALVAGDAPAVAEADTTLRALRATRVLHHLQGRRRP